MKLRNILEVVEDIAAENINNGLTGNVGVACSPIWVMAGLHIGEMSVAEAKDKLYQIAAECARLLVELEQKGGNDEN